MANDNWPWWPLLPLYPYGQRKTLCRELIPGQIWALEQLQGVFYVAVPIRMFVVKIEGGLLLYGAVATTSACVELIRQLELQHGAVCTIVHPPVRQRGTAGAAQQRRRVDGCKWRVHQY